ncbi:MAG: heavy-metal-associated domain-containing protein [Deltaproteobacteria bacterium]|nr:heavy-metal-associated domain-containing protein [Deltaproteobacteria bacterium]MBT4262647.1 heavy-metal-associated domain-containing protein [Deltaproteobacteria bacterium]MBT4641505.1 heavy-metal-associated domain-containing protein [Deltaproteobacteria bacterium]
MILKKQILYIACLLSLSFVLFTSVTLAEDSRRTCFKVDNMSCGYCIAKINNKLKTFDGYVDILVNLDQGLVMVDHRQDLTDSQIAEAVTSIGYPARVAFASEYDQQATISSNSPGWRAGSDSFLAKLMGFFEN